MSKLELVLRVGKWIDDTLRIIGLIAIIMFVRVNWFGNTLTFQVPNTPIFAQVVTDLQLEEYLEATKPQVPTRK